MKKHNPDRDLILLLLSLIIPLLGDELGTNFQKLLARLLEGKDETKSEPEAKAEARIRAINPEEEEVPEVPEQHDGAPIREAKPPKKPKAPKKPKRAWKTSDHKARRPEWRQAGHGPCQQCGEDVIRFQAGGCPPAGWTCQSCKAKATEAKAEPKPKAETKAETKAEEAKAEATRPDKGPGALCRCCGKELPPDVAFNRQNHKVCYADLRAKARALRLKAEEAGVPLSSKESEDLARRALWPDQHKD